MPRRQYISGFVRDPVYQIIEELRKQNDVTRSRMIEILLEESPKIKERIKTKNTK